MTTAKALLSAEDVLNMPNDGRLYELLDGVLVEMPPPGGEHGAIANDVAFALTAHIRPRKLGRVFTNDAGVILKRGPDRVRGADVAFVAAEHLPEGGVPTGYLDRAPDLVVEVISPTDRAADVQAKIDEWLAAGSRLVWAIYPSARRIIAFTPEGAARSYGPADTITGAPVLPDLSIPLADLFV